MMYLVWSLLGYLSGGVLYARLIPRILRGVDVEADSPDGNPGAANAFQLGGAAVGTLVLALELLKGMAPVYLASRMLDPYHPAFCAVLAAPAVGHAFPLFRFRRGGKAIAVSFGTLLGLLPLWQPLALLAGLYLFFSLVVVVSPHLFRSILVFGLFAAGCALCRLPFPVTAGCCMMAAVVIYKHFVGYRGEKPVIRLFKRA